MSKNFTTSIILDQTINSVTNVTYNGINIFQNNSTKFVVNGNLIIKSDYNNAKINLFNITRVNGYILIDNNHFIQDISFPDLLSITDSLIINKNNSLNSIDMSSLSSIGGTLEITGNSINGTSSSNTINHLININLSSLKTITSKATISNNKMGIVTTSGGTSSIQLGKILLSSLEKANFQPFQYSNYITIDNNINLDSVSITNLKIPTSLNVPNANNRTFKMGMIFKSPTMTQGNEFSMMRNIFTTNTQDNWFGIPNYKHNNLSAEQRKKPIIPQKTGSSSDYLTLLKSKAIGKNTTKYNSSNDKSILFANNNNNDVRSALRRSRNQGSIVPSKVTNR